MSTNRLFIFGYGYTARVLVERLRAQGGWTFAGTTRSPEKCDEMERAGVDPVNWENGVSDAALDGATHLLVSTPPNEAGCPALENARNAVVRRRSAVNWIGYLSTNGVYGDYGGAWVDEESELRGASTRAKRRITAEEAWRTLAANAALPLVIFRLPGIYGPGRSAIESIRAGSAKRIHKASQVFSRMHVDDIAAALNASMEKPGAGDLFNLADDEPAPPQDVVAYACDLLNVAPPPLVAIEDANLSDMAKSFYADNKRVSNQRMKDTLGVALKYPSFREGLRAILDEEGSGAN